MICLCLKPFSAEGTALKTIKFPSEKTQRTVSERGLDVLQLLDWRPLELENCRAGEAAEDRRQVGLQELYMVRFIHTGREHLLSEWIHERDSHSCIMSISNVV